ncbi:MAG TPA: hypothetical protein VJL38_02790 [Patescibacteria group bacterium]|nr:hypothetical protein [Patescibacteria group bacterium]
MISDEFLRQFWPQFWGSVMATFFVALLTVVFAYVARLRIARFFRQMARNIKDTLVTEEEKLKKELVSKE